MAKDHKLKVQVVPQFEKEGLLPYVSLGRHDPATFVKAVRDYRSENGHQEDLELTEAMVKHSVATERIDSDGKALIELSAAPASAWVTYLEEPANPAT